MWLPPCPVYVVLGIEPRTFIVLGRPLPPGHTPAPSLYLEGLLKLLLGYYIINPEECPRLFLSNVPLTFQ